MVESDNIPDNDMPFGGSKEGVQYGQKIGTTKDGRPKIFAGKVKPVQVEGKKMHGFVDPAGNVIYTEIVGGTVLSPEKKKANENARSLLKQSKDVAKRELVQARKKARKTLLPEDVEIVQEKQKVLDELKEKDWRDFLKQ